MVKKLTSGVIFQMLYKYIIVLALLLPASMPAQEVTSWEILSNMQDIVQSHETTEGLWCASNGGVFYYDYKTSVFRKYTKSDGLNGSPVTAITVDASGRVWTGCENGQIDIISPTTESVIKSIINIRDSRFTDKKINSFSVKGDTVFACTGFGISLMHQQNFTFIDTYFTLSDATLSKDVRKMLYNGRIFASLGSGIVVQKSGVNLLNEPAAWTFYNKVGTIISTDANAVCVYKGQVLAGTSAGIAVFNDTTWNLYHLDFAGVPITDLRVSSDSLLVLTAGYALYSFKGTQYRLIGNYPTQKPNSIAGVGNGVLLNSANGILQVLSNGSTKRIIPDGFPGKNIYDIYADPNGGLWVATGKNGTGIGLLNFKNSKWTIYNTSDTTLISNDFVNAFMGSDGSLYGGTWGGGFIQIKSDATISRFDTKNSPMVGIPAAPVFLVIGGFAEDSKSNLWVLNYYPGDRNLFAVKQNDTWKMVQHPSFLIEEGYTYLTIDDNDTKWFILGAGKSLHYYNEMQTFTTTADDKVGNVSTSGNLLSKTILTVAVDKRNELWVGTESGAYVLSDTRSVLTGSSPVFSALYPLRGFKINAIIVDGINRKWVATNKGLLLVSADGNSILKQYRSTDSPLLSDDVLKLSIDLKNGIVYAATAEGIIAIKTVADEPKKDYSEVKIYPNPLLLADEGLVTFNGLVKETEIKIMNAAGRLVKHIVTPGGGTGYWNGQDERGNAVPTGIYFIVLHDKEGTITSVEKLAVIRK